MMDLHCCESSENEVSACVDETLLQDRVLQNMLKTEDKYVSMETYSYLHNIQEEITDNMVGIVGEWMMEVCEEQKCQDDVFLLSMNYMHRFLKTTKIKKNQLQLLGAACMLLASKLREPRPFSAETLVFYTDSSITKDMLTRWELLVLSKLKWNIVAIVPVDFLPHLLIRLKVDSLGIQYDMVKNHAKILIALCAKECQFKTYHPSLVAAASIVSALVGLGWVNKYQQSLDDLLHKLGELISVDTDIMRVLVNQIDDMIKENLDELKDNKDVSEQVTSRSEQYTPPPGKNYVCTTATTPTDVHDVHF